MDLTDLGASKTVGGQIATLRRPKSEPLPQQVSQSMPLVRKGKGLGARMENTSGQCLVRRETDQKLQNRLKEATWEKITQTSPILEDNDGF